MWRFVSSVFFAAGVLAGAESQPQPAHFEMQGVHFRFDESLILEVRYLEGKMVPAPGSRVTAVFDDPRSFTIEVDSAEIAITTTSLSRLLNKHVFGDKRSPLKKLRVTTEAGKIKQEGTLDKAVDVPFQIEGRLEATEDGKIGVNPTSIKAAHIPVKGLMGLFGLDVADLINTKYARGVTVRKNDMILDPALMLPPPQMKGRITSVRIEGDRIIQVFGTSRKRRRSGNEHFIAHRGGTLQFGKLIMRDADLVLVDNDPKDPFDFWFLQYERHLTAGYSKTTANGGLRTYMPDYSDLVATRPQTSAPPRASHAESSTGSRTSR
jgi:hypothetical protein